MRVPAAVQVLSSPGLAVPAVVGVLWPALLIPASAFSQLSPEQIRKVLAIGASSCSAVP